MQKQKLRLDEISVNSFVTANQLTSKGGSRYLTLDIDNTCDGVAMGCQASEFSCNNEQTCAYSCSVPPHTEVGCPL
jgi:hypothetical protein